MLTFKDLHHILEAICNNDSRDFFLTDYYSGWLKPSKSTKIVKSGSTISIRNPNETWIIINKHVVMHDTFDIGSIDCTLWNLLDAKNLGLRHICVRDEHYVCSSGNELRYDVLLQVIAVLNPRLAEEIIFNLHLTES